MAAKIRERERQQKGKDGLTFFAAWAAGGKTAAAGRIEWDPSCKTSKVSAATLWHN